MASKREVFHKTAPVGQGFWSLGPQPVSAWTRCQKEAPPPRLSCSGSTFLGTPLSRTGACNTEAEINWLLRSRGWTDVSKIDAVF